jgi:hypothetical protein
VRGGDRGVREDENKRVRSEGMKLNADGRGCNIFLENGIFVKKDPIFL